MRSLILFALLAFFAIARAQVKLHPGDSAPPIHITDYLKNEPADKSLEDKYIIIDFWATWCGPCLAGVPQFNAMSEKYKSRKDVVFLSMTYETPRVAKGTLDRIDFKTVVVSDQTKQTFIKSGAQYNDQVSIPYLLLIDKWGKVYFADRFAQDLPGLIQKFLETKQTTAANLETYKNFIPVDPQQISLPQEFLDSFKQKDFKFEISDSDEESGSEMETKMYNVGRVTKLNVTLQDILADYCEVQANKIQLPESLESKRINLTYVNPEKLTEKEHRSLIKKFLLENYRLKETIKKSESEIYVLRAVDPDKLIISELREHHSSNNLTHLIVGGPISELVSTLYSYFKLPITDETKLDDMYEFILLMGEPDIIACELETYGLSLTKERKEVEHILFEKQ